MTKGEAFDWIKRSRIVPVIRASSSMDALKTVHALIEGGVDVLEITMTVPNAIELIREVSLHYSDRALIGAGTVYDPDTAAACIGAGARFIVGPCISIPTIKLCNDFGILVAPGALTATEIVAAWQNGADIVKVFPCDAAGGPSYIKSLRAPFPMIPLMPTGGVSLGNANDFIKAGAVAIGVGNSLVDPQLIKEGKFEQLTERAIAFRETIS
jgi:2-dehydro-3-deoxyphosphogluconate aldolase/(4S)-4-hydroxy-2-oxoglutarate aldolase